MKKFLALFFAVIAANAQEKINFRDGTLADMLQIAKIQNKPLLYMGYANWCEHCKKMKSEVITDKSVADFFNRNFVCTWHDMESGEGVQIGKKYNVRAFPAFLFLSADGELLYSTTGELTAEQFIKEGQNALDGKKQFPYLKAQFDADPKNPEKCLAYVSALRRSNLGTDKIAKTYFAGMPGQELVSATNWRIIANGIRDIDSREFQYVLANQAAFAGVSSAKRVERKIVNMVQEWLTPYVDRLDTVGYLKKRPSAAAIAMRLTDSIIFSYDLKIFEDTKGWKSYRQISKADVQKLGWENPAQLKEIAMNYMNNIAGDEATDDAISWAKRSLELKDAYDVRIIIARLYLKKGDKKSAADWAEKARQMAIGYKWDTKYADDVLRQIKG